MKKLISLFATMFVLCGAAPAAHAGNYACTVALCIAGNWGNIATCVPPVRRALRDAALGRGWPSCARESAAAGTTSSGQLESSSTETTQDTCPPMFQKFETYEMMQHYVGCRYTGLVTVSIGDQVWSTMYWNASGDSVIDYSANAKAQLGAGNYDTTYDTELAHWIASHPGGGGDTGCVPRPGASCAPER